MAKPTTGSHQGRRDAGSARPVPQAGESSTQTRNRLALNRFTYRGGYDGYEGRMILRPDAAEPSGTKR